MARKINYELVRALYLYGYSQGDIAHLFNSVSGHISKILKKMDVPIRTKRAGIEPTPYANFHENVKLVIMQEGLEGRMIGLSNKYYFKRAAKKQREEEREKRKKSTGSERVDRMIKFWNGEELTELAYEIANLYSSHNLSLIDRDMTLFKKALKTGKTKAGLTGNEDVDKLLKDWDRDNLTDFAYNVSSLYGSHNYSFIIDTMLAFKKAVLGGGAKPTSRANGQGKALSDKELGDIAVKVLAKWFADCKLLQGIRFAGKPTPVSENGWVVVRLKAGPAATRDKFLWIDDTNVKKYIKNYGNMSGVDIVEKHYKAPSVIDMEYVPELAEVLGHGEYLANKLKKKYPHLDFWTHIEGVKREFIIEVHVKNK